MTEDSTETAWQDHAVAWAQFVRADGLDYQHALLNLPTFLELLPSPGRLTVDLGCGEGRVGRALARLGHRVIGVDASATMAELAREAGGHVDVLHASAAAVPLPDGCADLVTSYMALGDMDDVLAPIREAARLLAPGGRLAIALLHPAADLPGYSDVRERYHSTERYVATVERGGVTFPFHGWRRPLSAYASALERAGLLIAALREPIPTPAAVAAHPALAPWRDRPLFIHLLAVAA